VWVVRRQAGFTYQVTKGTGVGLGQKTTGSAWLLFYHFHFSIFDVNFHLQIRI
jgi:hypothetical protein